ncbi:Charged multivesicular body protein 4b [Aphelenchoides bicaudatus]|nr:Charged multivesicular body protein 4b [Aphelenchoides bicaudatus]
MSNFAKIFGRKKEIAPTTQEALQKLRETEDVLFKKQGYLEEKIKTELLTAKKHGTSNKRMALQALRRKKQCENQLQQLDGILNTLSHQKDSLENATMNAEVLGVLANSSRALKNTHNMDIDKVHDLLEDIAEQQEVANEIAQAISNPIGLQMEDDDDLLAELERLEEEDLDKQLAEVKPASQAFDKLPEVPTNALPKARNKTKEDDEMAQLQAWAES